MTATTIDTERLKESINLVDLAGRYTKLYKCTAREWCGPCPMPNCSAGENGFHVHADGWWKCYTCHPKPSDVIEFAQRLRGLDFRAACDWLGADVKQDAPATPRQPAKAKDAPKWPGADWQAEARHQLAEAVARLAGPDGEPGRAYLQGRGIEPATWQAWGLGYGEAWDNIVKCERPAIVIPWQREKVTAIKYRFVDQAPDGMRYTAKGGGECLAFGLQMAGGHTSTLFLVEGEVNALSIWQALRAARAVNWDVISFGAEGKADSALIVKQARKYRQVIVWCDKADRANAAMKAISGAHGIHSPEHEGQKLDANALLQAGVLGDFLRASWAKCDRADAAKVTAYIEGSEKG